MSNILDFLLSEVMFYLKIVVFSMKKSYLKEFQGDIGWVILIFSFKFDAFGRYGSKTNDFPWKLDIFGMKTPVGSLFHRKTSDFMKIHEILKKYIERDSFTV